jgi:hypothetical protein
MSGGLTPSTLRWTPLFSFGGKRGKKSFIFCLLSFINFQHPLSGFAAKRVDERSDVGVSIP